MDNVRQIQSLYLVGTTPVIPCARFANSQVIANSCLALAACEHGENTRHQDKQP